MSSIIPTVAGPRLGMTTRKFCCAESPSGSDAVTVMIVVPFDTARTVRTLPVNRVAAMAGSDLEAA